MASVGRLWLLGSVECKHLESLVSVEIRAGWSCPHLLLEEPVTLASDRRSLPLKAPIAGAGSVRVMVNDSLYIPPSGLLASAVLTATSPGPYRIQRCVRTVGPDGNLFTVTTGEGSASVRLPEGDRISADKILKALRLSGVGDLVSVSEKNQGLSLQDSQDAGPESTIRVSGSGAASLGFGQTGARGSQVYPGWDLVARRDVYPGVRIAGVTLVPARYPRFKKSLPGSPTIKVTYTAMPERCPRCGGTYVENDYRFDLEGRVITIQNEDLLYQACLKAVLTVQGSNPYHPEYGSKILTRIGRKVVGASASLIREDVLNALKQVQALQTGQKKYQRLTNSELLYTITSVGVRPSEEDPTVFYVDAVVKNFSNKPVNLTTVFSVPGAVALAGTNGQVLGIETTGLTAAQSSRLLLDG